MDRPTRIARGLAKAHDRLRRLFNQEQCIKLLAGDQNNWGTPIATYDSHWYLDKHEYSDVIAGKRYKRLVIDDVEGCRLAKLKSMTAVQIGDDIYTFHGKDSFVGSVPSYEFKVVHKGQRI
jgi:hypothetical protein